jgi:hypothetical protein
VSTTLELWKHTIKQFELSTCPPQQIVAHTVRIHCILNLFKHKGMIADLLQLHHGIIQTAESFPEKLVAEIEDHTLHRWK